MLLAIDTVTRWTGLALFDGQAILAELGWRCQNTQTIELAPAVADLMKRANGRMTDLSVVAVASGPGSYTGMRVGMGFAKGLSLSLGLPMVGIPTLAIVAAGQAPTTMPLIAVAEAGRTRLLTGRFHYHKSSGWLAEGKAEVVTAEALADALVEPTLLAGELSEAARSTIASRTSRAEFAPAAANVRRPGLLAEMAWGPLAGWGYG